MAGFKNLEDLVGDLSAGLVKLRAGELEPEELTPWSRMPASCVTGLCCCGSRHMSSPTR